MLGIGACTSGKINAEKNTQLKLAKEKVPGITMERLKLGEKVYIRDCSGCHALHKPSEFTIEQWQPILIKMFVKSKISDSITKALITDYVIANSK